MKHRFLGVFLSLGAKILAVKKNDRFFLPQSWIYMYKWINWRNKIDMLHGAVSRYHTFWWILPFFQNLEARKIWEAIDTRNFFCHQGVGIWEGFSLMEKNQHATWVSPHATTCYIHDFRKKWQNGQRSLSEKIFFSLMLWVFMYYTRLRKKINMLHGKQKIYNMLHGFVYIWVS